VRTIDRSPDYFESQYRDYEKQNPPQKLDHYLDVIDVRWAGGPADLLDLGCGRGAFLERAGLRHPTWGLYGTDIDAMGVETSQTRVPGAEVSLASADIQSHPDRSFDIVTAWDVIEHVEATNDVATSIGAMLRPGGLFLFVVPVYDGPLGWAVKALDKDPTHLHKQGRNAWLEWAADRFEVIEWHGIFRYLIPGSHYIHHTTHRMRNAATAILVVCSPRP